MVLHGIARNAKRRRYLAISLALGRMRENIDPYPVYLHCWMITIDCIGTITFWMLLSQHLNVADIVGGAWVFVLFSCGLPVWVFMEAKSIIHDIKDETSRQIYFGGQVTPGTKASEAQARTWCLGMIAVSFFVNAYALSMLVHAGRFQQLRNLLGVALHQLRVRPVDMALLVLACSREQLPQVPVHGTSLQRLILVFRRDNCWITNAQKFWRHPSIPTSSSSCRKGGSFKGL